MELGKKIRRGPIQMSSAQTGLMTLTIGPGRCCFKKNWRWKKSNHILWQYYWESFEK